MFRKKVRVMKKLLAIVLCLLLMTAAVPTSVFAAYGSESNLETVVGSYDFLGRGFNALSASPINEMEISRQISIFNNDVKSTLLGTSYTTANSRYAKSVEELMSSFGIEFGNDTNVSVPVYVAKVGIESKFSASSTVTNKAVTESIYYYYYQETITNRYSLQKNSLDGHLSDSFIEDLEALNNNYSATNIEEFFDVWGTHILTSYNKGGFLEYTASAHSTATKCTENAKVSETIGASVGVGNASVGTSFSVAETMASEFGTSDYILQHNWNCYGGQSNLIGTDKSGTDETVVLKADEWKATISHENAVMLPQSTQWKAIWEFIPDDEKYADLIAVLQNYYGEKAQGANAAFFAKYTTYYNVKNATQVYYVSPTTDAAGNNLIFKMNAADRYIVDPAAKINIVNVGTDLSKMYIDVTPANAATVDVATGYVTFADTLNGGDEVTVKVKERLPDGTPSDTVRAQGTYVIRREGTNDSGVQMFAGGYGDAERPYLIADATQLSNIRNANKATDHFRLIQDIDVGTFEPLPTFAGTLDGNNYTLLGGRYTHSTNGSFGLFKEIAVGATVKNVILKDFYIDSTNQTGITGDVNVGLLCGVNGGTIDNVRIDYGRIDTKMGSTDENVKGNHCLQVGLLCGDNSGTIIRCGVYSTTAGKKSEVKALCEISPPDGYDHGDTMVGGLVGYSYLGTISHVYVRDCIVTGQGLGDAWRWKEWFVEKCRDHGIPYVYAGGVIGRVTYTNVDHAVAYDNNLDGCSAVITDCDGCEYEKLYKGALIGELGEVSRYSDCYGETGEGWFIGNDSATSGNANKLSSLKVDGIISKLNGYATEWYQPDGTGHIRIAQNDALVINDTYIDTAYFVGEPLNITDIEIKPVKEGSVTPVAMLLNGFTVTGYDPAAVGEQTVTVTYGKVSGTYTVTVKEPEPVSLFILTMPDQVMFQEGDPIDYTGLTAAVQMDNGEMRKVALSNLQLAMEDVGGGNKKVTATYGEVSTEFVITVTAKPELPADAPTFAVEDAVVCAGKEFTVPVNIRNNSGIVSLKLKVEYDTDVLELLNFQQKDFDSMSFSPITNYPFIVNWVDAIHPNNTTDGVVVLLTFRVREEAEAGTTAISLTYDPDDVYDQHFDNVAFRVENGTVRIAEYTPGDLNSDGKINNKDLGLLQQYVNEWAVTVNEGAADTNGDGKVNNKDLGLLQQYVNEWDVELG